jgi:protein LTV1
LAALQEIGACEELGEYEELGDDDFGALLPSGVAEDESLLLFGPTAADYRDIPDIDTFKKAHKHAMGAVCLAEGEDDEEEEGYCDADALASMREEDFDDFLADEYAREEVGAIEDEDIEGHLMADACEEAVEEYLEGQAAEQQQLYSMNEPVKGKYDDVPRVIDETKALIEKFYTYLPGSDEETLSGDEETDDSRLWDCESVLSTLSNISNRPGRIGKIKLIGKPKPKALPRVGEEEEEGGEKDSDDQDDATSVIELPDVITERKPGETSEEKRARKASVKEMRRVCRQMKKESKEMYKNEAARLPGNRATTDIKSGLRYQRL